MWEKEMFIIGLLAGISLGFVFGCIWSNIFSYDGNEMNDVLFYTLTNEETKAFIESQFDQGKRVKFNYDYKPCATEDMMLSIDKQLLWKELRDEGKQ